MFYFLFVVIPEKSWNLTLLLVGEERLSRIIDYLFKQNNPVIMILYLFISPGCYLLFVFTVMVPYYAHLDHLLVWLGNFSVWVGVWLYYKTCVTDPGTITEENYRMYTKQF